MAGKRLVGLAALLLALALTAPSAAGAASTDLGVRVLGEGDSILAIFNKAKCRKGKHDFDVEATSADGQYELRAEIHRFTGFHKYDVSLGSLDPLIVFTGKSPGTPFYSNQFVPPFPVPGAGLIKFSTNGKRAGIGFGPAMWSDDFSSAVVVAGALECRYPRKKG